MSNKAITINENYRICPYDDKNVVLQKYYPSKEIEQKDGSKKIIDAYWKNFTFHANIKQAITKVLDMETNIALEDGLQDVLDKMNELQESINSLTGKYIDDFKEQSITKPTKEEIELGLKICEAFGEENIADSDIEIEIDGVKYAFNEVQDWKWEDEGKYQYGDCVIQAGVADKETPWRIEEGKKLNIFIKQEATKCGSYFSYTEYTYEKPYLVKSKKVEKEIWVSVGDDK